jgi:hypothetical protein
VERRTSTAATAPTARTPQKRHHAIRQRRAHVRSAIRSSRISVARSSAGLVSRHSAGSTSVFKSRKEPTSQNSGNTSEYDVSICNV